MTYQAQLATQDQPDFGQPFESFPDNMAGTLLGQGSIQVSDLEFLKFPPSGEHRRIHRAHLRGRHVKAALTSFRVQARRTRTARELQWIAAHRDQYAGAWVALVGDRLLAQGDSARQVFASVANSGDRPLVIKIEPQGLDSFGGW